MTRNEVLAGYAGGSTSASMHDTTGPSVGREIERVSEDDVDVEAIVETVESYRATAPSYTDVRTDPRTPWRSEYAGDTRPLPKLTLPGFGESSDQCGEPFLLSCDECGHTVPTSRTPATSTCPRCGNAWARNRSEAAVAKLEALRRYHYAVADGEHLMKFHHLAVSPGFDPPFNVAAESRQEALQEGMDLVKEVIRDLGGIAGLILYHPWSGDNDGLEDDRGKWKHRLFEGRDWAGDVHDELQYRPHFHVLVVSPYIVGGDVTKRLQEESGLIVERITDGGGVSIGDLHDLARAVSYSYSHAGLYDEANGNTRVATRWFGKKVNYVTASDRVQEAATKAVRDVVPETLDLPYQDQRCHASPIDDVLDISLGGSSGGNPWPSASGSSMTSKARTELPTKRAEDRGELPAARDGDLPGDDESFSVPYSTEGRLEALRKADPSELVAEFDAVTWSGDGENEVSVWDLKDDLEDAEVDEEVCGGTLRPVHDVVPNLDDPEWADGADRADELTAAVDAFLLEQVGDDVDEIPSFLTPLVNAVEDLDRDEWLTWDPGPG